MWLWTTGNEKAEFYIGGHNKTVLVYSLTDNEDHISRADLEQRCQMARLGDLHKRMHLITEI